MHGWAPGVCEYSIVTRGLCRSLRTLGKVCSFNTWDFQIALTTTLLHLTYYCLCSWSTSTCVGRMSATKNTYNYHGQNNNKDWGACTNALQPTRTRMHVIGTARNQNRDIFCQTIIWPTEINKQTKESLFRPSRHMDIIKMRRTCVSADLSPHSHSHKCIGAIFTYGLTTHGDVLGPASITSCPNDNIRKCDDSSHENARNAHL